LCPLPPHLDDEQGLEHITTQGVGGSTCPIFWTIFINPEFTPFLTSWFKSEQLRGQFATTCAMTSAFKSKPMYRIETGFKIFTVHNTIMMKPGLESFPHAQTQRAPKRMESGERLFIPSTTCMDTPRRDMRRELR
jgi:hypothetical protein